MVIVRLSHGFGNQTRQYIVGKLLAYKLNTDLKLDISWFNTSPEFNKRNHASYRLSDFNIVENFATPEEIKQVKEKGRIIEGPLQHLPDLQNFQGDVYVKDQWPGFEGYFSNFVNVIDTIRKEFTLKKPLGATAETWRQKILSAECSVAMHFRHGDFAYVPNLISNDIHVRPWFYILPLDYYYTCLDILKQRYNNPTVFVFSDNMLWIKENLRADAPTEFVEGCATDNEEFALMTLCKHMIKSSSSFSACAAFLNSNPDKKNFASKVSTAQGVQQFLSTLTPAKKEELLDTKGWISIPFDYYNQPEITQRPIFSLLLVVNDAANLPATLDSILNQDYKYYEVIIIDNATTNGSDKICQDAIADKKNVTYKRLPEKISNAAAWNEAFKAAQGKYVLFLKVGVRFLANSLSTAYLINDYHQADIIHMFAWLEENAEGNVAFVGRKFSAQRDERFKEEKRNVIMSRDGLDAARLLLNRQINSFLSTKLYNIQFLTENKIKFDETLADDEAELFFQVETFFKSKYLMYASNALYVLPFQNSKLYFSARVDIKLVPKTQGDFKIVSVSDDKADVRKPDWFQKGGIGYQIQSRTGKLEIAAKATTDGQLRLDLLGLDVRTPGNYFKRIPYWVDYTKLAVNGKIIFDKVTPAWHDKRYVYTTDVKADEEIKIQINWLPHDSET